MNRYINYNRTPAALRFRGRRLHVCPDCGTWYLPPAGMISKCVRCADHPVLRPTRLDYHPTGVERAAVCNACGQIYLNSIPDNCTCFQPGDTRPIRLTLHFYTAIIRNALK